MAISLQALERMGRAELTKVWTQTYGAAPPPSTSQDMMRLIIGWEIQAKRSRADVRALRSAVKGVLPSGQDSGGKVSCKVAPTPKARTVLMPGMRLSREWKGRTYCVDVLDKGYAYDGRLFTSLTPIAKVITGGHRSGPLFFGIAS